MPTPNQPAPEISLRAREAGTDYVDAILDACAAKGKRPAIDPVRLIECTDAFPAVLRDRPMLEFMIGWLHGVADSHGVEPGVLWEALVAAVKPAKAPAPADGRRPILLGQAKIIPSKPRKRAKAA